MRRHSSHATRGDSKPGRRRAHRLVLFLLSAFLNAAPAHSAQLATHAQETRVKAPKIRIASDGWGNTDINDLQFVLRSVLTEFGSFFPDRPLNAIKVVPGGFNPTVLFEKGSEGEYIIELSARNGRWYQFAYQFSHELCHVYSNFDNKTVVDGAAVSNNQWFEESVCEAAALFTLRRLAERWESAPPSEKWGGYARTFARYAERLFNEPHRRLPEGHTLAAWLRENQRELTANPYLRDKDEVVSNVLLELFERNPDNWGAIGFLNAKRSAAADDFERYLEDWCQACPEQYRQIVERIQAMFGSRRPASILAADE